MEPHSHEPTRKTPLTSDIKPSVGNEESSPLAFREEAPSHVDPHDLSQLRPATSEDYQQWLSRELEDPDSNVRKMAVRKICQIGAEAAVNHVEALARIALADYRTDTRLEALSTLSLIPREAPLAHREAAKALAKSICDPEISIQKKSWDILLGNFPTSSFVIEQVAHALGDNYSRDQGCDFLQLVHRAKSGHDISGVQEKLFEILEARSRTCGLRVEAAELAISANPAQAAIEIAKASTEGPEYQEYDEWERKGTPPKLHREMVDILLRVKEAGIDVSSAATVYGARLISSAFTDSERALAAYAISRDAAWRRQFVRELNYAADEMNAPRLRAAVLYCRILDCADTDGKLALLKGAIEDSHEWVQFNGLARLSALKNKPEERFPPAVLGELLGSAANRLLEDSPRVVLFAAKVFGAFADRSNLQGLRDLKDLTSAGWRKSAIANAISEIQRQYPTKLGKALQNLGERSRMAINRFRTFAGIKIPSPEEPSENSLYFDGDFPPLQGGPQ